MCICINWEQEFIETCFIETNMGFTETNLAEAHSKFRKFTFSSPLQNLKIMKEIH